MPRGYLQIPDWFSSENQGGGIAVAHLTGGGAQDLVVMMVDSPVGKNRGLYRVGRSIDQVGNVTGGWTGWIDVPDWFSWENEGAGLAVSDVDNDGHDDLIVFMIDAPDGKNQGYYRIGKRLDADGNVLNGWGPWIAVPDWFSFENQHGSITVADLDHDGNMDLIVMMVDSAVGQNRGLYRIGKRLDSNGNVTAGWTDWIDVPDWFSWENQGAGVTTIDFDNNGQLDLLIFQIDNAIEQNQAFYKIGKNLKMDGSTDEWSLWRGLPAWFAWDNQGGGITSMSANGKTAIVVSMIDNPPGQNAGYYRVLPLDTNPGRDGEWELLKFNSGVLAVHAALLPQGKVLFFAGSGSSAVRFNADEFGDVTKGVFTSAVWDPAVASGTITHPATLFGQNGRPYDFFCGGDTFLADGRLLSAGGTGDYDPFKGRKEAAVFDFLTGNWSFVKPMAQGRWYPSLITLADGRVLAASGFTEQFPIHNKTLEIYNPPADTWQVLHFADAFPGLPLYAHLFLLADGRVVFDGGRTDDLLPVAPCIIDITQQPLRTTVVNGLRGGGMRNQAASVLLPPAQDQKVMIIGGGPPFKTNKTDAIDSVDIVDLKVPEPHFVEASPLNFPRLHLNAIVLPDHTVFVTGGSLKQEDEPLARLQPEIYDPLTDTWTPMALSTVPRLYHSTALLLPDGSVLAAGGNPDGGKEVQWNKDLQEEMRLEVFRPTYFFKGQRPIIANAPPQCTYGQALVIASPQSATIRWASLVRNCVTTHSWDGSQRLVDLEITDRAGGAVTATVPVNGNIAPPGWYMLFLIDNNRVPSVSQWIQLN